MIHMYPTSTTHRAIMTEPSNNSHDKLPAAGPYGRITRTHLLDEESDEPLQDSIEAGPISRIQTASRFRPEENEAAPEEAFQHDIPLPLTGLWRRYSDQMACEGVQNADFKEAAAATANTQKNKARPPAKLGSTRTTTVTPPNTKKPPATRHVYGTVSKVPLIDEDDDEEEEEQEFVRLSTDSNNSPMPRPSRTTHEDAIQSGMPTGFWRLISDQYAREGVQIENEHQQKQAPPTLPPVRGSSSSDTPGMVSTAFTETRHNDDDCSIHALAGYKSEDDEEARYHDDDQDETRSYASPVSWFQDTLESQARESSTEKNNTTSYLDPDLVRRSRLSSSNGSGGVPKMIHVSSSSEQDSLVDAMEKVDIHSSPKHAPASPTGKKYVRVHGMRHAKSAIEKGESIVVKCSTCKTKFQVDKRACALYCIHCKSVTQLASAKKKKLVKSI